MIHRDLPFSEKELIKAKKSLKKMKELRSQNDINLLDEFESHWIDFLINLEKIWKKAELECKDLPKFQPWQGVYKRERKKDPLLSYLKNARDVDQHSIQQIAIERGYEIKITSPLEGATFNAGDTITIKGEVKEPRIETQAVTNRSEVYQPPIEHLDKRLLNPNDPIELAELGLAYYENFLDEIKLKFLTK